MFWKSKNQESEKVVKTYHDPEGRCCMEMIFCMKSGCEFRVVAYVDPKETSSFKDAMLKQICSSENRWFVFEENTSPIKQIAISIAEIECVKIEHIPYIIQWKGDRP